VESADEVVQVTGGRGPFTWSSDSQLQSLSRTIVSNMPVVDRLSIAPFQRVANGFAPTCLNDKLRSLVVDRVGVVVTNSVFNVDDKGMELC
jgi:hypothetical protein